MKKGKVSETAEERMMSEPGVVGKLEYLRRTMLRRDEQQPRTVFDEVKLQELATSIRDQGIIQPLIVEYVPEKYTIHEPDLTHKDTWQVCDVKGNVEFEGYNEDMCRTWAGEENLKPYYRIVAGERRWRGAELAELDIVPCIVRAPLEAQDRFKVQHAENNDREGLTPMEEAESFYKAVYVDGLFTVAGLAQELGRKASHVYARIALAKLPAAIKEAVADGKLNAALAELVAKVPGEKNQLKAMKEIQEGGGYEYDNDADDGENDAEYVKQPMSVPMSVRRAKQHLRGNYMLDLEDAVFDIKAKELLAGVSSCLDCPLRSGNCKDLFPEIKNQNICTDPDCHAKKVAAHMSGVRAKAEKTGLRVLTEREAKPLFRYSSNSVDYYHEHTVSGVDDKVPGDWKNRTIKQLLGKDVPEPVAVVTPQGKVEKVILKEDVAAALKQKGMVFADPEVAVTKKESPEQKAERERVNAIRLEVAQRLRAKVVASALKLPEVEFLQFIGFLTLDDYELDATFKRLGLKCKMVKDEVVDIQASTKGLNAKQMRELIIEDELGKEEDLKNWDGTIDNKFLELCKVAGVDFEAAAKSATNCSTAELENEKARAATKPAKKKGKK